MLTYAKAFKKNSARVYMFYSYTCMREMMFSCLFFQKLLQLQNIYMFKIIKLSEREKESLDF